MNRSAFVVVALLPLLLAGCFGAPYRAPAPVVERAPGSSPASPPRPEAQPARQSSGVQTIPLDSPESRTQIAAYEPPAPVPAQQPTTSTAVAGLLAKADEQQWAGDTAGSAATLERALRIEPGNAYLWTRLAQLRFELRQFAQAEDLAAKSNSLAGADRQLRRDNWLLIAKARRGSGDQDGARRAEQEAEALR